jgi:hypothetical protein
MTRGDVDLGAKFQGRDNYNGKSWYVDLGSRVTIYLEARKFTWRLGRLHWKVICDGFTSMGSKEVRLPGTLSCRTNLRRK